MAESDLLLAARDAAVEAGRKVMEVMRRGVETFRKEDLSPVTNADHAADALIRQELRRRFPEHGLLSEESGWEGPTGSEFIWMIDPLDGTRAFARGGAGFSVMVGLLKEGKPYLGVVFDPRAQTLIEAERGQGAYLVAPGRRVRMTVSARRDWLAMPVITSTGFPDNVREFFMQKHGFTFLDPIHSVGVKVGYVVRRLADVYFNHHPVHLWDTAAPLVILEEAGGRMTDALGQPLAYEVRPPYSHGGVTVASNSCRHDELVALLKEATCPA